MNEQRVLRILFIVLGLSASIGLAVTLAVTVSLWLGWAALAVPCLLIALKLIAAEREERAAAERREARESIVGPWISAPEESQV